ncbi:MFS transporter [Streptomyces sioyaensis]|uniref:MFS transporter n=1 Tax=Streptomyces sioyaensis TaxID=67364 RepID=UPI0037A4CD93
MDRLAAARPSFRAVWGERFFRRFLISRVISLTGDAIVPTALALSLNQQKHPAGWLGGMLAAALLPKVLFLSFGGVAADRLAKLPLMAVSSVVCGVAQLATAMLLTTSAGLWWALGCQVVFGVSTAVCYPATFGYLPHCVSPDHLPIANALLGAWSGAASLIGPALTAVLAALGSPSLALAADGASFLLGAVLLVGLPRGGPVGRGSRGLSGLREGWTELRRLPWLMRITVVDSLILMLVTAPFIVLGPALVERTSHDGWALLMLLFAAGELLGSLVAGRVPLRRPIFGASLGLLAMGLPPLLLAGGAGLGPLCAAQVFAGAGIGAYGVLVNTAVQQSTLPEHLSKIAAFSAVGSFAFLPLGYVLAPLLAMFVGSRPLLWVAAAWTVVSVGALVSGRPLRELRAAGPPHPTSTGRTAAGSARGN